MLTDIFRSKLAHAQSLKTAYEQRFLSNVKENLFMGSFKSFDDAVAHAPPSKAIGYDNAAAARTMYSPQVCSWDYAPIYWISDAFARGMTSIFDLGGHVGIKYYAFKRMIEYPETLRWTVCDVPGVVLTGEQLAKERQASAQLKFCADFRQADGCDVLYLSGSLQYLPCQMSQILATLSRKPHRVVLNITAAHELRTMYTLNSIGFAVCPYRIQHQDEILSEIRLAGYQRRDVWRNDGKEIRIPFVEGGDSAYYFGCCFDRVS